MFCVVLVVSRVYISDVMLVGYMRVRVICSGWWVKNIGGVWVMYVRVWLLWESGMVLKFNVL